MSAFQSNIISIYGEKGNAWLDELPQLVMRVSSRLDLRDLIEVTNLTYNYVLSGFQGDDPIILKLGLYSAGLKREACALKCFEGHITRFAELFELPSQRIRDWCFVQAVLSWMWAIEDGCDVSYCKQLTKVFDAMPFNRPAA